MEFRATLMVFLLLGITSSSTAMVVAQSGGIALASVNALNCRPKQNEVLNDCFSPCEKNCKTRFRSDGQVCAAVCSVGCSCTEGYLKNNFDECVPVSECQTPVCNSNEVYKECGTACEENCSNYNQSIVCTIQCVEGCFCKSGTIRESTDSLKCITPDTCPSSTKTKNKCGPNEVYNACGSLCEVTCKNRLNPPTICADICVPGCGCVDGYLKNDNGTCVPKSECSTPKCNEDEQYSTCGSACQQNCDTKDNTCLACTLQCVEGCFCKKGTIRESANSLKCIKPDKCPVPKCTGENEMWDKCPATCPPTEDCAVIWSKYNCPNDANSCCKPQCRCKPGYFRNDDKICISTQCCIDTQGKTKA